MRPQDLEEAKLCSLFSKCRPETAMGLLRGAFIQNFPTHTQLNREGEVADFLFFNLSGTIELTAHWRNRETTIDVIERPRAFIVAAVVMDRLYLQSSRVLKAARILMLPAGSVRSAMQDDAGFATAMAEEASVAYRHVAQELKGLKLRSGIERLANWLINQDILVGSAHAFNMPYEKKVLAARIGLAPEVLSRAFSTLAKYGVRVEGAKVWIGDIDALRKLAFPDPLLDDETI